MTTGTSTVVILGENVQRATFPSKTTLRNGTENISVTATLFDNPSPKRDLSSYCSNFVERLAVSLVMSKQNTFFTQSSNDKLLLEATNPEHVLPQHPIRSLLVNQISDGQITYYLVEHH
jgi:hypothetical protein